MTMPMPPRRPSPTRPVASIALLAIALPSAAAAIAAAGCAGDAPEPGPPAASSPASPGTAPSDAERVHPHHEPRLTPQSSGTTGRLQAVSPVDERVVWASGVGGTYALTTDGGATWQAHVVPGGESLEFRDVHGVSDRVAYLLAAGTGPASRIYKTVDGGATWSLQFQNQDPAGFDDCFAFWTPTRGLVMADSSGGRFPVLRTVDGQTWQDIGDHLPAALQGESAFAASGTCVATVGPRRAWIATGGAERARVLATVDGGETWAAYDTPIPQGTASSGAFTVAFRDIRHGMLGGGDLAAPGDTSDNTARSRDGGKTWQLAAPTPFPGAIYGLAYALGRDHTHRDADGRDRDHVTVVATGPGGAAWSADEGDTWSLLPGVASYWAVGFASHRTGWLVGTEGRILKIEL